MISRKAADKANLPSDYEPCGECGYDHGYEPVEAYAEHQRLEDTGENSPERLSPDAISTHETFSPHEEFFDVERSGNPEEDLRIDEIDSHIQRPWEE